MCGIAGVFAFIGADPNRETLRFMGSAMRWRGPDGTGYFCGDRISLVHTRLSILDLTDRGMCPMPNEDGSIQVLLNGEIYNWRDLRTELVSRGHRFRSMTDSEVLSHGYEEWKDGLFARLRGMYAIAIWDSVQRKLLLARDRIGEKPLFVSHSEKRLVFSSMIAALDRDELTNPDSIDEAAVCCYFSHTFIPATHTVFREINVFPPAHFGVYHVDGKVDIVRYWDFPNRPPTVSRVRDAENLIRGTITDSVNRCMDADVPVGVFLSGGIDSSVVAALASRRCNNLHSFACGFGESTSDELPVARHVAEHLGLTHHECVLSLEDVVRTLPFLVWQFGQPFGDSSAIPTFWVSQFARQLVKVCLGGDGGDESFAGYWRVYSGLIAERYRRVVPYVVRKELIPAVSHYLGGPGKRLSSLNRLSFTDAHQRYGNEQSWFRYLESIAGPRMQLGLTHDVVSCRVPILKHMDQVSSLQKLLLDDFKTQLPDAYLVKVDVASMAASLEVRSPLLDSDVVEAAWRISDRLKLRWGVGKWLLRRIAGEFIPADVIHRRKVGFGMPLDTWFRSDLATVYKQLMSTSRAAELGWINRAEAERVLDVHLEGRFNHHVRLWLLLWFEIWIRMAVTKELTPHDSLLDHLACKLK
ncbi:MAG: asparagine synthase (glutamine-hydrolyzing) [Pirellulaceae bacterium]